MLNVFKTSVCSSNLQMIDTKRFLNACSKRIVIFSAYARFSISKDKSESVKKDKGSVPVKTMLMINVDYKITILSQIIQSISYCGRDNQIRHCSRRDSLCDRHNAGIRECTDHSHNAIAVGACMRGLVNGIDSLDPKV